MAFLWKAAAAGLGVALAQKFVAPRVPASIASFADGAAVTYGVPILGAAAGLYIEKMINK
jgi:hypothetical protein